MGEKLFKIDLGSFYNSSPEIVAFLWKNIEIFDALVNRKFKIERISDKSWSGSRYGIKGLAQLEYENCKKNRSECVFLLRAGALGIVGSTTGKIICERINSKKTYLHGLLELELTGILSLIPAKNREIVRHIAYELLSEGKIASEMLHDDFEGALKLLNTEEKRIILKEKDRMLENSTENEYEKEILLKMLEKLESKYNADLLNDICGSVDIVDKHPALAMVNNRKIIEKILRKKLVEEGFVTSESMTAGYLLDKAVKELSNQFPFQIIKHLRLICDLGGLAAHDEAKEENLLQDAIISTLCTGKVLEWHFESSKRD